MEPGRDKLLVDADGAFPEAAEDLIEGAIKNLARDVPGGVFNCFPDLFTYGLSAFMAGICNIWSSTYPTNPNVTVKILDIFHRVGEEVTISH